MSVETETEARAPGKTRKARAARPRPRPRHADIAPFEMRNNWSLRRAGLWGRRVIVAFESGALRLAGSRRGNLDIRPEQISRLLVDLETAHRGGWHMYRTAIFTSTRLSSVTLKLVGRDALRDPDVAHAYAQVVRELAWGLERRREFGRVRLGRRRLPVFAGILTIISCVSIPAFLDSADVMPLSETPMRDLFMGLGLILLVIFAVGGSALYACIHRRVSNIAALDDHLPTPLRDRSGRMR